MVELRRTEKEVWVGMMTEVKARNYLDIDGNFVPLIKICRQSPEWANNRICTLEDELVAAKLEIQRLEDELVGDDA